MGSGAGSRKVLFGFPLPRLMGMAAGVLILLVGAFVLRAKPRSRLHQLFFALAFADGLSTFAFDLAVSPVSDFVRVNAFQFYYFGFITFIALLIAFGVYFPRRVVHGSLFNAFAVLLALVTLGALVAQALVPSLFWTAGRDASGGLTLALAGGGRVVATVWVLATAFIIVRGVLIARGESSGSHRLQGALVLGGMSLGYAPFATTSVITGFRQGLSSTFLSSAPDTAIIYWASFLTTLAVIAAAIFVLGERRPDRRIERNVVFACLLGVLVLTIVHASGVTRATADTLQVLALLAYPLLLGYAIIRYEVLDIDSHLRRAATTSFMGAGFTGAFILFEVFLEQLVQGFVSAETPAGAIAGPVAAVLVALIAIPLARFLKKAAGKVAPSIIAHADVESRKREIYRHALAGAAADGNIAANELRVLARLRESLRISEDEHHAMVRELGAGP